MPANKEIAMCAALGIGAAILLYMAMQQTDRPIPQNQQEYQTMGLGIPSGYDTGRGTPLDMRAEIHFWNPGDYGEDIGVVTTPHRYPSVPGGNLTAVMHHGWACLTERTPAGNGWFLYPPAEAVI